MKNNLNITKFEDISIDIFEGDGIPFLCTFPDNSKIQIMLENTGQENIKQLDIIVVGKKGSFYDTLENVNIKSKKLSVFEGDNLFMRVIEYNNAKGNIKEIKIIPYGYFNDELVKCKSQTKTYQDISLC